MSPISLKEWNEGRTEETLETRILKFLQQNKDKAFSSYEIAEAIGELQPADKLSINSLLNILLNALRINDVERALRALIMEGKVKVKYIKIASGCYEKYYRASG